MRFHARLLQSGKSATGIQVPDEIVEALGDGKRPPVRVSINGFTYRTTVASMGGQFMIPVSALRRAAAGVAGGDDVDVDIELDTQPREVTVPVDFAAALDQDPDGKQTSEALAFSHKQRWVVSIEDAKTPETHERRIAKAISTLREG